LRETGGGVSIVFARAGIVCDASSALGSDIASCETRSTSSRSYGRAMNFA
jgi:hypothetical protein